MPCVLIATLLAAATPAPVALLASVGTTSEENRHDVDAALRQALRDEDSVDLLSPVETNQHVMSFAEMGLVCLPEDVACLVKLGQHCVCHRAAQLCHIDLAVQIRRAQHNEMRRSCWSLFM